MSGKETVVSLDNTKLRETQQAKRKEMFPVLGLALIVAYILLCIYYIILLQRSLSDLLPANHTAWGDNGTLLFVWV